MSVGMCADHATVRIEQKLLKLPREGDAQSPLSISVRTFYCGISSGGIAAFKGPQR